MGQSNSVIDSVLLEAGQPGDDVVGENVVYLELGVDWTSYRSKVIRREQKTDETREKWRVNDAAERFSCPLRPPVGMSCKQPETCARAKFLR